MATQRMTVATLAGDAATVVTKLFTGWLAEPNPAAVDRLCASLREHWLSLPIVYFSEWADRWSMGDWFPDGIVEGRRYQAACLSPKQAETCAARCGNQFFEQGWLATRLREAAVDCASTGERCAVVLFREVIGPTATDDDVRQALSVVPQWLDSLQTPTEPDTPAHGPSTSL